MFPPKWCFSQNGVDAASNSDAVELFVFLCHGILLKVLQHGSRRQLVKLQRIGRRFHKMIETYFRERPFLRLHFRLAPGFVVSLIFNSKCITKTLKKSCFSFQLLLYLLTILGMDLNALFWHLCKGSFVGGNWPNFHVSSVLTRSP